MATIYTSANLSRLVSLMESCQRDTLAVLGGGAAGRLANWQRHETDLVSLINFVHDRLLTSRENGYALERHGKVSLESIVVRELPHLFSGEDIEIATATSKVWFETQNSLANFGDLLVAFVAGLWSSVRRKRIVKDFRRLTVWERAHALTLEIYDCTATFPREEQFGIVSQMRRSSASIAANIAEGCGRTGNGEFHRFLNAAAGSAVELEYFLLLSFDLKLLPQPVYERLHGNVCEVQRMLASLLRKVDIARRIKASH